MSSAAADQLPATAATKSQGMNQYEYPAAMRSRKMAGMGRWMARNQRQLRPAHRRAVGAEGEIGAVRRQDEFVCGVARHQGA